MPFLYCETMKQEAIQLGRTQIIPVTRTWRLQIPFIRPSFGWGAFLLWQKPHHIQLTAPDGQTKTLPIHNRTWHIQLIIYLITALLIGWFWLMVNQRRS